jgi:NAD(P)-dependent dehydrogenase (short-subunit alcohol dehydrogenase family)
MASSEKCALVTGASKGLGRGIAIGLAEAGWSVGINYFNDQKGAEATAASIRDSGGTAWILQADVGDSDQVRGMFDAFTEQAGDLDLLVNNAGVQTWAPLLKLSEEDWERTIRTNLTGCYLCTRQAALRMKQAGGGCIINIGSGANKAPFPNLVDYCASKGGIENFTSVTAAELGQHNIRVNCVAPGCIEVERTKKESPDYAATWAPLTPLGRIGNVNDVAGVVAFMASDAASFITGQTLHVDGGLWSQRPWPYPVED